MTRHSFQTFEQKLGSSFNDKSLLVRALTHSSFLNENPDWSFEDNERLEFLGDAVLDFIVGEYLYHRLPEGREGELTTLRAALVRTETLAGLALGVELGRYLRLGRGEEESGGRERPTILCSAFEAFVGALYLDQGIETVTNFVVKIIAPLTPTTVSQELNKDAKSRLQEWSQRRWHLTPSYRTVAESGPDHAKEFTIEVVIGSRAYGVGTGSSKQTAEQAAALAALSAQEVDTREGSPIGELD